LEEIKKIVVRYTERIYGPIDIISVFEFAFFVKKNASIMHTAI